MANHDELGPATTEPALVSLGLIGVGTIASAIVNGLCTPRIALMGNEDDPESSLTPIESCSAGISNIVLSPRNPEKAQYLVERYPGFVSIVDSNQEVLDRCDWILLCVRPQIVTEVLMPLSFDQRHLVISLVATVKRETISQLTHGVVKMDSVVRAVPLPSVARHEGVTIISPSEPRTERLFNSLSTTVSVPTEAQAATLQAVTCLMGPYYAALEEVSLWCRDQGTGADVAAQFTTAMFTGIAGDAVHAVNSQGVAGLRSLVKEQTPGGLNENAIRELREFGTCSAIQSALTHALQRLTGQRTLDAAAGIEDLDPTVLGDTVHVVDDRNAVVSGAPPESANDAVHLLEGDAAVTGTNDPHATAHTQTSATRNRAAFWNGPEGKRRRLDKSVESHSIMRYEKQRWCVQCGRSRGRQMLGHKTLFACRSCQVPLCVKPRRAAGGSAAVEVVNGEDALSCFDEFHRGTDISTTD